MRKAYFAAFAFVGSHDDAMELSQSAFVKAYNHFDKFEQEKSFFVWYYKILKNLSLNFIRDSKKNTSIDCFEISLHKSTDDPTKSHEMLEQKEIIKRALAKLKVEDREIIVLKEFENYSYKELSDLFEIPIGTVMSKLFYARKKLAENLNLKELTDK